ncbi:hypothetical protein [Streptomyces sp. SudanB52_2052]
MELSDVEFEVERGARVAEAAARELRDGRAAGGPAGTSGTTARSGT